MNAATQKINLQGGAGLIEALLDVPSQTPLGTAVIAHPHPLFGGTMTNQVVQTLARAFVQTGWRAVRFNFRGVGASDGVHDEGRGEAADMLQVIEQVAPVNISPSVAALFTDDVAVVLPKLGQIWKCEKCRDAPRRHPDFANNWKWKTEKGFLGHRCLG